DPVRQARHVPLRLHAPQQGHARDGDRQVTLADLRIAVSALTWAVSAGILAALVPDHFGEGTGAGVGFVAATVLLALLAVILTRRPSPLALAPTILVFAAFVPPH